MSTLVPFVDVKTRDMRKDEHFDTADTDCFTQPCQDTDTGYMGENKNPSTHNATWWPIQMSENVETLFASFLLARRHKSCVIPAFWSATQCPSVSDTDLQLSGAARYSSGLLEGSQFGPHVLRSTWRPQPVSRRVTATIVTSHRVPVKAGKHQHRVKNQA